jgi:uncharacterized alkaline shock family protein YloU
MTTQKKGAEARRFDAKEFEIPETLFVRDIENRVFQNIVAQCVSKIRDVALVEGGFIDNIFGRSGVEGVSGVQAEQDNSNQALRIRVEVNISYGTSIPEKAEEIQTKVTEEVTRLTGLHVACVHVVFKDLIAASQPKRGLLPQRPVNGLESIEEEYTDEFK